MAIPCALRLGAKHHENAEPTAYAQYQVEGVLVQTSNTKVSERLQGITIFAVGQALQALGR